MQIKAFRGYRPGRNRVARVASRPYDVLTTAEAREEAAGNPYSFLNIVKPEITFPEGTDPNGPDVYHAAATNFQALIDNGTFVRDEHECLYIYELSADGKPRTGIVAAAAVEDYLAGRIRKHELTRFDKEADRAHHIRTTMLNVEPVMFAYRHDRKIDDLVNSVKSAQPEYEFVDVDSVQHRFWIIEEPETVAAIIRAFAGIPATYVADGHHRTAAAAIVSRELDREGRHSGAGPGHNYFLAVHFPDNQLEILDYNRLVADLNGLEPDEFLRELAPLFVVDRTGNRPVKPKQRGVTGMYLAGIWYRLSARSGTYDPDDVMAALGVSILSDLILEPILDIKDQRTDPRIAFVGGARGTGELQDRVDSGEMAVAFTLYPVTVQELMTIADTGRIMPPKATWFEPKLRSGLVVYSLKD
ncbi:MAG: DUF1015 family protein [Gammaproteobacteria bacterium]|nr:DUF1015 family protein [Gammaproteobacteria bacterium]